MTRKYAFHPWTPQRKARFVEFRMSGMHSDWAIFWALIDRKNSQENVFPEEEVLRRWNGPPGFFKEAWSASMTGRPFVDKPPQHLYDELQEGE